MHQAWGRREEVGDAVEGHGEFGVAMGGAVETGEVSVAEPDAEGTGALGFGHAEIGADGDVPGVVDDFGGGG